MLYNNNNSFGGTLEEKQVRQPYEDDEIDLYELWLVLKRRKKIVLSITALFIFLSVLYCFIAPPVYRTKTTIYPLGGTKGGLSSLLSSLPISLPVGGQSGLTVEAVLESRTLKERVIKDLNLLPKLFPGKWDLEHNRWKLEEGEEPPTLLDGVKKLSKLMSVSTDKNTGILTLTVDFERDPKVAYEIAKTSLQEAENILNEKSFSIAKRYRIYIGKQLALAKEKLEEVEKIYRDFVSGKIKEVPLVFGTDDRSYGMLKGKLIAKEKMLELLESSKENQEEIEKLKKEVEDLKRRINSLKISKPNFVSLPDYQLNLQKLQAQMDIAETLFATLVKEYEMAKAQEMKEQVSFQVVDPPYIPDKEKPYKPKKALIVGVGVISGLFLGIFAAFFKEWLENVKRRHSRGEVDNA